MISRTIDARRSGTPAFTSAPSRYMRAPKAHSRIQAKPPQEEAPAQENAMVKAVRNAVLSLASAAVLAAPVVAPLQMPPPAQAVLTPGDPIKNARAILRYALPINNKPIRIIQMELEGVSESLRIPGSKSLGPIAKAVRRSESVLKNDYQTIVKAFAPSQKEAGLVALAELSDQLARFNKVVEAKDKQEIPYVQQACLERVGTIEEAMVQGFPFTVPAEYANLPQLKGRATVVLDMDLKSVPGGEEMAKMVLVLDGYSAPVSAGNFVDLVQKGFYNGMPIQRADGFVVQTGKPDVGEGYVDPNTGRVRTIPLEIKTRKDKEPFYEDNLEDLGLFNEQPALPFNAFGTMAMARSEFENNSASSQVFWLLKESELTPSGANLLDGRYAVFGYAVEGQDLLQDMKVGDVITKATVVSGADNLVLPS